MTIKITDLITGESYLASSEAKCRDFGDRLGYRIVEAYGKTVRLAQTVYEVA